MNIESSLSRRRLARPTLDKTSKGLLAAAVANFPINRGTAIREIQSLRNNDPLGISRAAVELLEAAELDSRALKDAVALLTSCSLLAELFMDAQVWPIEAAAVLAVKLRVVEPKLDVQLVKQVFGKAENVTLIAGPDALRLLALIDAISDCSALGSYLIQFQRHPSDRVRSKSALMLGRSNSNPSRVQALLKSDDHRLRANAVESLWGHRSGAALDIFWEATRDSSARVVANALLGLCRAGQDDAFLCLADLAGDADPMMRSSGAWAMGEAGDPQFLALLEKLTQDPVATVRERAEKSRQKLAAKILPQPLAITAPEAPENVDAETIQSENGETAEEGPPTVAPGNGWLTGRAP